MSRECKTILMWPQPIVGQRVTCAISCGVGRGAGPLAGRASHRVQAAGKEAAKMSWLETMIGAMVYSSAPGGFLFSGLSLALD